MSDPKQKPAADDQTTLLHLGQFVPADKAQEKPAPAPSEEGMTVFIKTAASETMQQTEQPLVVPKDAAAMPPKAMLGAVSYCYAKGVYRSEDIERKLHQDPEVRSQLGADVPDAKAIRRFRRFNREAILRTMEKAFRFRRKKSKQELLSQTLPGAEPAAPAPTAASAPEADNTTLITRRQAQEQLEKATFIDNMSKEE